MPDSSAPAPHRILVVANRTCPCPELHAEVHDRIGEACGHILVVAPALNESRLAHFVSDSDGAEAAARERLDIAVEKLTADGVRVDGVVGDAQPLQAIEDALVDFRADEVIISTHPAGDSSWLEKGLLEDARAAVDVPVHHFVTEYGLDEARAATAT